MKCDTVELGWLLSESSLLMRAQNSSSRIHLSQISHEIQAVQEALTQLRGLLGSYLETLPKPARGRPSNSRYGLVIYHLAEAWRAATGQNPGVSTKGMVRQKAAGSMISSRRPCRSSRAIGASTISATEIRAPAWRLRQTD